MKADVLTMSTITLAVALMGGGLAFLDSRHASAMDVQQLTEMIHDDRVEELEYKIEDIEAVRRRILLVPLVERNDWEAQELINLKNKKDRYIRKLERIRERMFE